VTLQWAAPEWQDGWERERIVVTGVARMVEAPAGKAHEILAKSLYRELRDNGYTPAQILAISAELIAEVTEDYAPVDPSEVKS